MHEMHGHDQLFHVARKLEFKGPYLNQREVGVVIR